MTSGGSESLLLIVKTYRDRALELYGIENPEMILCVTAHAVFEKGIILIVLYCKLSTEKGQTMKKIHL